METVPTVDWSIHLAALVPPYLMGCPPLGRFGFVPVDCSWSERAGQLQRFPRVVVQEVGGLNAESFEI